MNLNKLIDAVMKQLDDTEKKILGFSDIKAHVERGILEYTKFRPRRRPASITLIADQAGYTAPADCLFNNPIHFILWGNSRGSVAPWDIGTKEGQVPRFEKPSVNIVEEALYFLPAPTVSQIAAFGSKFEYVYNASHAVNETASTIPAHDDPIVEVAALAEACEKIAIKSNQGDAFVKRYKELAKHYRNRFEQLLAPGAFIARG